VFKSTNGGTSWTGANEGLSSGVSVLAIDPVAPDILYADGVWKSTDGAATWSPAAGSHADVTSPLVVTGLFAMAIDPMTPSTLYVSGIPVISGTRSAGGVSKSTNGSPRWHSINAGLGNLDAWAVAVDPVRCADVYGRPRR